MPKMVGSHAIETIVDGKGGDGFPVKQTRLVNVYDPAKIQGPNSIEKMLT